MLLPLRKSARTPPPVRRARPWAASPQAAVQHWFERVLAERMQGLPFLNPALSVQALHFHRFEGDWLGGLVTPWSVQLMLLPGGGRLWIDTAVGARNTVALPVGALPFIADGGDRSLPAFQYLPLVNGTGALAGDAEASALLRDALATALQPAPALENPGAGDRAAPARSGPDTTEAPMPTRAQMIDPGRRRFLRLGPRTGAHTPR